MNLIPFNYDGNVIEFELNDDSVMVNATQMAKVFSKDVSDFFENRSTQRFIEEALNNRNSGFLNVETEEDLFTSKQKTVLGFAKARD